MSRSPYVMLSNPIEPRRDLAPLPVDRLSSSAARPDACFLLRDIIAEFDDAVRRALRASSLPSAAAARRQEAV